MPAWSDLSIGTQLTIVKLAPDGSEAARYPGSVIETPAPWLVARARWVIHEVRTDGLSFVPGDRLHEFFSPEHWFNVFSVFAPNGGLRGWYANVTYPSRLEFDAGAATLFWHDLYLDVIVLPNGEITVRDEDELAASGLESSDPDLHARILATRDEIVALARARDFPFHET